MRLGHAAGKVAATVLLLLVIAGLGGCARAARDTSGFALENRVTVNAPFNDTWQAVKHVLREQGYDIYTRDKRGIFVAYSQSHRSLILQPHRIKYTVEVGEVTKETTSIYIQTVRQVYGVTLLTYPDWHDRKMTDNSGAVAILDAVQAKVQAGGAGAAATMSATTASSPAPEPAKP